jgi:predicted enzyme related to lactoylglutathione lyase
VTHDGASNGRNGGLRRQVPEEAGVPPHVMPYFGSTGAIEESVAKVEELGGGSMLPVTEVPAGKFAGVIDPQGAHFMLFEGEFDE